MLTGLAIRVSTTETLATLVAVAAERIAMAKNFAECEEQLVRCEQTYDDCLVAHDLAVRAACAILMSCRDTGVKSRARSAIRAVGMSLEQAQRSRIKAHSRARKHAKKVDVS